MKTAWNEELALLKSILLKTGLEETTKWGIPVFTYNGKNVVGIAGFKSFFSLWFYNGSFLEDKKKVLINASEGQTKALRQWRFHSIEEIDEEGITAYVQEAIENEKQGKRLVPQKKEQLSIPAPLDAIFKDDILFAQRFASLSPSKQNEYIEHIDSAKQEKTKLSRIDKMRPLVLNGQGLHDKYKK
jgi:uncharacterized protein YdeI (YjbR/CyaY-like superfamily)